MKLHTSVGPNHRVVKMFLAEKGLALDCVTVDLMGGENRRAPYTDAVNPAGQTPALDSTTAMRHRSPPSANTESASRARRDHGGRAGATRMWTRRDIKIASPYNGLRHAEGLGRLNRMRCFAGGAWVSHARDGIEWLRPVMGP